MTNKYFLRFAVLALVFCSCSAQKRVPYLPDAGKLTEDDLKKNEMIYEAKIMPKDVLTIAVNTVTPEAAAPFNLGSSAGSGAVTSGGIAISGATLQTYVVDNSGDIDYPVVGKLHVAGLTRVGLQDLIKEKIYPAYITEEPIINARFQNYKVSILGEVARPGSFTLENEQCTIFDALALAGDLTIYGNRNRILLIREDASGGKHIYNIDLQNNKVMTDPDIYYLQQNDVIYVEPNKAKARQAGLGTAETFTVSVVGILISLATLVITIVR